LILGKVDSNPCSQLRTLIFYVKSTQEERISSNKEIDTLAVVQIFLEKKLFEGIGSLCAIIRSVFTGATAIPSRN
jgi:hypothetical protein